MRPKVEKGIAKALPEYIGPAKRYEVRAEGSDVELLRGDIDALHIVGYDVQLTDNLTVGHLIVDMKGVQADTSTRKLKKVESTTFRATVTEKAVNDYVNASRPDGSEIRIDLDRGKLTAVARPSFHGIGAEVKVTGKPQIEGGSRVSFVADKASLSVVPVPAWIVNKLLERVNPVLDLDKMKFPVTLTSVATKKDAVDLAGNATFKP